VTNARHHADLMHAHDDLRSIKLLESMLNAVGNIGSDMHLRLNCNVSRSCTLAEMLQKLSALCLVFLSVGIIVYNI